MKKKIPLTLAFTVFSCIAPALADHGPGTSGSGFTTLTAETLKPGTFSSTFQFDWTEFDVPGGEPLGIDLLDRSFLSTLSVSYGVVDNFQLGLTYGYFAAEGNREFEEGEHGEEAEHGGEPEVSTFDPDGFTDLWLTGKYRFYQGPAGQIALIGGIKFPTGDSRLTNSAGEQVEPAATAGTGAWDGMAGLAYTVPLNAALTLDASALYTFRGERYDYRLGDRLDVGTSLAWRVCGDATTYPQVSLVAEATLRHVEESEQASEPHHSGGTGGTVLFLSPGVKMSFSQACAANLGVQLPVVQDLNGNQVETDFRVIAGISFSF